MEWLTIISTLVLPMLAKCWGNEGSSDPQEFLKSKYDSESGKMDPATVRRAVPATRKAIAKAKREATKADRKNFPKYTKEEVYSMAEDNLVKAMSASKKQATKVYEAAMKLGDDE